MPYLRLDLPGTYPVEVKRELATRLCELYAEVMETQLWRPNVGIAELGKDNLYHFGFDGLEPITMVLVEFRRGRSAEKRLALGRAIVDVCVELLGLPRRMVLVEFTPHAGEEMLRDGNWVARLDPCRGRCGVKRTEKRLQGGRRKGCFFRQFRSRRKPSETKVASDFTAQRNACLALFRGLSWVRAVGSIVDGGARGARRKRQRRRMLTGAEDLVVEPVPRFEDLA